MLINLYKSKKMVTIKQLQQSLKQFDSAARRASTPSDVAQEWKTITKTPMSPDAANAFFAYYKEMRSKGGRRTSRKERRKTRRMHGGEAPVNYTMVPGLPVNTYGNFPVEVDIDPGSIKDLDVYFHDSLPLSPPGYWPQVPANMGSNKVGGRRRTSRKNAERRRRSRKQRGGNLLETLTARTIPFLSTPYPNMIQSVANQWNGGTSPVPTPSSPVDHTWALRSGGMNLINPNQVTDISSDFSKLASPPAWQTSN